MGNFEAFSQESSEIKEIDWVQQQVKAELQDLQKESFYTTGEDGKVNYDMEAVTKYLTTIQQKNWSDLTSKNSSAWIMAVQIALEKRGIDVGKVDGIFGAGTRAAVRTFQEKNEITADGLPGPQTIAKLLEGEGEKKEGEGEKKEGEGEKKETETLEKMDLAKVNIDVLKKVYGETIDKNWKGFQEKRNVIEIGGLKFKKWTEGMTGLGYRVKQDDDGPGYLEIGQYVDGYLTGKGVILKDKWDSHEGDFINDQKNGKGTGYRRDYDSGRVVSKREGVRKEGECDGRGVVTYSDGKIFKGHREQGELKGRGTTLFPNGDKMVIDYMICPSGEAYEGKGDYIFSTGEKIYGEWLEHGDVLWCTRTMPDGKELEIRMEDYEKDRIIEVTSFENTIKIKVEKDYFVFQPESPRLAFPRGKNINVFAIAHALNGAIKHVKDTLQKVDNYEFDQFESSFSGDFVQIDRKGAALDIDLIDTRKYPGMNATKVSDWLNANAETFGLLNTKKSKAKKS